MAWEAGQPRVSPWERNAQFLYRKQFRCDVLLKYLRQYLLHDGRIYQGGDLHVQKYGEFPLTSTILLKTPDTHIIQAAFLTTLFINKVCMFTNEICTSAFDYDTCIDICRYTSIYILLMYLQHECCFINLSLQVHQLTLFGCEPLQGGNYFTYGGVHISRFSTTGYEKTRLHSCAFCFRHMCVIIGYWIFRFSVNSG